MGSGVIAGPPQTFHVIKILIYADNTYANGTNTSGAYQTLKTISLTNAQADYAKITVECFAGISATANVGTGTVYMQLYSSSTSAIVGNEISLSAPSDVIGGTNKTYAPLSAVFTAGTDYTRGTAFDIVIRGKGVISNNDTVNYETNGVIIEAVSD
jgi:hypothetical protein